MIKIDDEYKLYGLMRSVLDYTPKSMKFPDEDSPPCKLFQYLDQQFKENNADFLLSEILYLLYTLYYINRVIHSDCCIDELYNELWDELKNSISNYIWDHLGNF